MVAFERDEWDERLSRWLETAEPIAQLALHAARLLFELGRGVLRVLTIAENAAVSFILRRMELEADRYQARLAGTGSGSSPIRLWW